MSNSSGGSNGGIGVLGLLGIVFVALKLCNIIDWSWWYVLMPFYGVLALILIIIGGAFAVAGIAYGVDYIQKKYRCN